ncbi:hypothetical protein N7495_000148 [Penicillium taxi]|uniref:uncharacterized protein n=1 Tax=Penicillium taxi TaxID=168475 RepID=UPI00254544F3|nr:uncharacterized protein N7495_000148 [Penicillium taxi]KAJ5907466.1 hypothetical protein N7495_000148 [Penicillium taxi]
MILSLCSAWELRINNQATPYTGSKTQACQPISIPRGAKISWVGSKGATTLQLFNVQGKCSQVYRTITGVGEINASSDIFGYMVKA